MPIVVLLVGWWISSSIGGLVKSVDRLCVEVRELKHIQKKVTRNINKLRDGE